MSNESALGTLFRKCETEGLGAGRAEASWRAASPAWARSAWAWRPKPVSTARKPKSPPRQRELTSITISFLRFTLTP